MAIDECLWREHQYGVLVGFVHHVGYYRSLYKAYGASRQHSEFWTRTIDAHILSAVTNWCMVFGADANQIHWKRVLVEPGHQDEFREALLKHTGLTSVQWDQYWTGMTAFRNDYVAHRETTSRYPQVPEMDVALEAVYAYDGWIRRALQAEFDEAPLKARYQQVVRVLGYSASEMVSLGPTFDQECGPRL